MGGLVLYSLGAATGVKLLSNTARFRSCSIAANQHRDNLQSKAYIITTIKAYDWHPDGSACLSLVSRSPFPAFNVVYAFQPACRIEKLGMGPGNEGSPTFWFLLEFVIHVCTGRDFSKFQIGCISWLTFYTFIICVIKCHCTVGKHRWSARHHRTLKSKLPSSTYNYNVTVT